MDSPANVDTMAFDGVKRETVKVHVLENSQDVLTTYEAAEATQDAFVRVLDVILRR